MESGGNHVRQHRRILDFYAGGYVGEVSVRVVYVEEFAEHAVFEVRELPACKHAAGVHRITCLSFKRVPVGSNSRNQNLVSGLKILNQRTDFYDFAAAFVAQNHVVPVSDCTFPYRVNVGRTRAERKRFTNGVHRTAFGVFFFDPAGLADLKHRKSFHTKASLHNLSVYR